MKILVAYDKNTTWENVLAQAVNRAKLFNAYIYLVRTCSPDRDEQEIAGLVHRINEVRREHFKSQGIECESHVLIRGLDPGEDLVQYAREKGVDEIIIGVVHQSKVGKALFGSVAQHIILNAHCPVVCVK